MDPTTRATLADLIERFDRARETSGGDLNETQTRVEFIDPLFLALGWDMHNRAGHAEAYKDVIHEDAIHVGGATEAPDYCFRIGGRRIFFLEAKRPSIKVKDAPAAAYLRQIAATDAQIDQLVYQLYDLTPDEIHIVKQATAPSCATGCSELAVASSASADTATADADMPYSSGGATGNSQGRKPLVMIVRNSKALEGRHTTVEHPVI